MTNQTKSEKEKKNKKRGLVITFWLHAALVALAILPFLSNMPEPPKQDPLADAITIEFVAQLATTKKPSTSQSSRAPKPKEEKPAPIKPKPKPVDSPQPKPQPKPNQPLSSKNRRK